MSWTEPDGTTGSKKNAEGKSIKIYTEAHFAVVGHNDEGEFAFAFAGEYVWKGDTVTEKLQKGSSPETVGTEATHQFTISGDDWESTRAMPDGGTVKEVWKRLK